MDVKLIQVGNSLAVPLPADLVEATGLKAGRDVALSVDRSKNAILVRFPRQYYADGKVTPEFERLAEEMLDKYADAWRRLADS